MYGFEISSPSTSITRSCSRASSGADCRIPVRNWLDASPRTRTGATVRRSEEHTSELQSLMRISYAVFCLKKKKTRSHDSTHKAFTLIHSHAYQSKSLYMILLYTPMITKRRQHTYQLSNA